MPKITFIGAGSTVFAKNLLGDILSYPELAQATISLHDIDPERLRTSEIVARKIAEALGANPTIEATIDRRQSLAGADYAIAMFQVGGYRPSTVVDFEIPKKYGLRQTIADTLGIGGIMRGLRTIPVLLDMAHDMEELCPDVTFLQYVNPMAMNTWALDRASSISTVGLCHSVPHTAGELAADIGVPVEEIDYLVAGINHMAFYLKFERQGQDLYPAIRQVMQEGRMPPTNRVRYKLFEKFGYFVTESSEHLSEYVPWFIKRDRPDLIEKFNIPLDEYITRCEFQLAGWEALRHVFENENVRFRVVREGDEVEEVRTDGSERDIDRLVDHLLQIKRSVEYGSQIIHAMETGHPAVIYGNVGNHGLIDNLPQRLLCRGSLPGRSPGHPADPHRRASAAARRVDADQHQRPGADRRGRADRQARAHLPRRHARPAHRRRARSRSDHRAGGRPDRSARRLAAGVSLESQGLEIPG